MALLLGTIIGTAITVVGGILGGILTHRREYTRWLREQRRAAYADALVAFENAVLLPDGADDYFDQHAAALVVVRQAVAHVAILGPDDVADAAERLAETARTARREEIPDARSRFAAAARSGLRSLS